jgi:hypothetical protein
MEKYKIVSGGSPNELTDKVNVLLETGNWSINGSHQVVILRQQNRFRGDQHLDTLNEIEYSQMMFKKTEENVIKVDIAFYHPNDDETKRVYDEEGMREEFEYKMDCIIRNAGL